MFATGRQTQNCIIFFMDESTEELQTKRGWSFIYAQLATEAQTESTARTDTPWTIHSKRWRRKNGSGFLLSAIHTRDTQRTQPEKPGSGFLVKTI